MGVTVWDPYVSYMGVPVYIQHRAHIGLLSGSHIGHIWAFSYTSNIGPISACYLCPIWAFPYTSNIGPIWACYLGPVWVIYGRARINPTKGPYGLVKSSTGLCFGYFRNNRRLCTQCHVRFMVLHNITFCFRIPNNHYTQPKRAPYTYFQITPVSFRCVLLFYISENLTTHF